MLRQKLIINTYMLNLVGLLSSYFAHDARSQEPEGISISHCMEDPLLKRCYVPALRPNVRNLHKTKYHVLKHSQSLLDLRLSRWGFPRLGMWRRVLCRTCTEVAQVVGQCRLWHASVHDGGLIDIALCRRRGSEEETSVRVLCECESLATLSMRYLCLNIHVSVRR